MRTSWLIVQRSDVKLYRPYYQLIKRTLDLLLCLLLAPFLLPVIAMIALLIRLDSPGPIFFTQERIGKGGRRFNIIKFRTMYHNIDHSSHRDFMKAFINGQIKESREGASFKPFRPHQVTPVGRFLRKTSLDELPQLINIFRGEMSLVGPRPNVLWEVEEYQGWHNERLEVLPGITGLAQIRGRSAISFDDIVNYDIEYLERRNLWFDFQIMWWTITSVISGAGAE